MDLSKTETDLWPGIWVQVLICGMGQPLQLPLALADEELLRVQMWSSELKQPLIPLWGYLHIRSTP